MVSCPFPEDQPTLTVDEAARLMSLGRSSTYEAVRRGDIPSIRIGNRWLVPTAAIRQMLSLPTVKPRSSLEDGPGAS